MPKWLMMGGRTAIAAVVACASVALVASAGSFAAAPPDPHDPCSSAGRDTCGTVGVGLYRTYSYGLRWFGDYRGAVPGESHLFCLDLDYWYASRAYRYRLDTTAHLRLRTGHSVSVESEQKLAYAIWRYGRSADANRQAAVMLYVHSLMADARPGEIDPAAAGPKVASLYKLVARDTSRYHGPYRVEASLPSKLLVERAATASLRVVSAHGNPLPYVRVGLSASGASHLPAQVETNGAGVARVSLTPTAASGLRLRLVTAPLAAPRPRIFVPTAAGARANGQRLAAPATERLTATVVRRDVGAAPRISTQASAQLAAPGARIADTVAVTGLGGASVPVRVELWGPFASRRAIRCSGAPYWTGSFVAHGNGSTTTTPVRLDQAGYFSYRESIAPRPPSTGFVAPCGTATETTFAKAHPDLTTSVSNEIVRPGARIADRVHVRGLGKSHAAIEVELFGPFESRAAIRCTYPHLHWRGRITVRGEGDVRSPPAAVNRAGFYAFRERLIGSPLIAGLTTPCARASEISLAAPQIVTGRGDIAASVVARGANSRRPARLRIASFGIDAHVSPSGIDLAQGVLGIPSDIHRLGWWSDGMTPGIESGAVLIAGHVDSARAGAGAFFQLGLAQPGDRVQVTTAGGAEFAYRVASVRNYLKSDLPTSVYSHAGPARLVLVTCGGPFDAALGHYRENIVVTADPVR